MAHKHKAHCVKTTAGDGGLLAARAFTSSVALTRISGYAFVCSTKVVPESLYRVACEPVMDVNIGDVVFLKYLAAHEKVVREGVARSLWGVTGLRSNGKLVRSVVPLCNSP